MRATAFAAAALCSSMAFAEPPPAGWIGQLPHPVLACDTMGQVESIFQAGVGDPTGRKAKERYVELRNTPNSIGEPTCQVVDAGLVGIVTSVSLGEIMLDTQPAPAMFKVWATHITKGTIEGWLFYIEAVEELDI